MNCLEVHGIQTDRVEDRRSDGTSPDLDAVGTTLENCRVVNEEEDNIDVIGVKWWKQSQSAPCEPRTQTKTQELNRFPHAEQICWVLPRT